MKRRMEIVNIAGNLFTNILIQVNLLYVTYFIFYNIFTGTGVGKIFLQINSAAVAFIDILIAAWEGLKLALCYVAVGDQTNLWTYQIIGLITTLITTVLCQKHCNSLLNRWQSDHQNLRCLRDCVKGNCVLSNQEDKQTGML